LKKRKKLLKEIDQNKSYTILSEKYGIGRLTICDIKRKEVELPILSQHERDGNGARSEGYKMW